MTTKQRAASLLLGVGGFIAVLAATTLGPGPGMGLTMIVIGLAMVVLAFFLDRGVWRPALWGLVAGAVAGVVVLGPGFRVVMRVVAMLDPIRRPEFTFEGTLFIVIAVGLVFGGIAGAMATLVGGALPGGRWLAAVLDAGLVMAVIVVDTGLRSELVELGTSPWLNALMFGSVSLAHGVATTWMVGRLERRRDLRLAALEGVKVPA